MAGNRMGEQTRGKILAAAEEEFINKGFEKARVDDIAAKAGVTKMMLYYHFNTKQNIFKEIVNQVIAEIKTEFQTNIQPQDRDDLEKFRAHLDMMVDYYLKRQKILRVIMSEYIGQRHENESLSVFNDVFVLIMRFADKKTSSTQDDFLVRLFFFNALPMLMYSCLADSFSRDFGVSPERTRKIFISNFVQSFQANSSISGNLV